MSRDGVVVESAGDAFRVEAPITIRGYLICGFGSLGGILFGYDYGYINGVMGMPYFIHQFTGLPYPDGHQTATFAIPASKQAVIVAILSVGTFIGALISGDLADVFGRRNTIIAGCAIYSAGVVLQVASAGYGLLIAGRMIAGIGVGFESAIVILYISEIAPRKVRGSIVSGYQFCITVGILLASCVVYKTQGYTTSASYRVPIAIQWVWALILGVGLCFLPDSPRFFVKRGRPDSARQSLARLRGQPRDSDYISQELAEIVANNEYELRVSGEGGGYFRSWMNCFKGSILNPSSNLRRTILGTCAQMFQQLTGIGFIFYFGTTFFSQLGTIQDPFLISLITTLVNVCSTPVSFWAVERFGRRPLLIYGAAGMCICQFIIAIAGTIDGNNPKTVSAEITFICLYIFFFASTWGPGAWVVVGEMFSLPIRARGVALSVASNWFWNTIVGVITPYMVNPDKGNLGAKVFFVWGSLCGCCFLWSFFSVYETKGLSLEQIDQMLEETSALKSSKWVPSRTFSAQVDKNEVDETRCDTK